MARQEQHEHELEQKVIKLQQRQERYELKAELHVCQHSAVAEERAKWEPREQKILLLKVLASKPVTASSTIYKCVAVPKT